MTYLRYTKLTTCLVSTVLLTPTTFAQPPIRYDGWNVDEGHIDLNCPVNASCSEPVLDNGFATRNITIDGHTYVQTVLTERGVSGDPTANPFSTERGNMEFFNEVFVLMNSDSATWAYSPNGFASKMEITESDMRTNTIEDRMVMSSIVEMGQSERVPGSFVDTVTNTTYPFMPVFNGVFDVISDFEVSTIDYSGALPEETFYSTAYQREYNNDAQHERRFDQYVDDGEGGAMKFAHRDIGGVLLNSAHEADPQNPLLPGGTNGGELEWGPNAEARTWSGPDRVTATWFGQDMSDAGGTRLGYTKFWGSSAWEVGEQLPLGETKLVHADPDPAGWHESTFGPTPDMASRGREVTATAATVAPSTPTGTIPQATPLTGTGPSGPPIEFDNYVVSSGTILADCPQNATCTTGMTADGFLQREITVDGITYYQTIVTEAGESGTPGVATQFGNTYDNWIIIPENQLSFSNESFVRTGGINGTGVASRLALAEQAMLTNFPERAAKNFEYSSDLNTGWARGGEADPILTTTNKIHSYLNFGTFDYLYDMKVGEDEARDISLVNHVSSFGAGFAPIDFVTRSLRGGFQLDTHTPNPNAPILPGGGNGGDISWGAGESIQATWVGGRYLAGNGLNEISVTAFQNRTSGEETRHSSLDTPQSLPWPDPFGPTPVYDWDLFD